MVGRKLKTAGKSGRRPARRHSGKRSATAPRLKTLPIRAAFGKAFGVFNKNRGAFLRMGAFWAASQLVYGIARAWLRYFHHHPPDGWTLPTTLAIIAVVAWLTSFVYQVEMTRLALKRMPGPHRAMKANFGLGWGIGRYFHASILSGLAVIVGFLLLVVPGLIVGAALSMAAIAALEYRVKTWHSLAISVEMTRGVRIKVWGFMLALVPFNLAGLLFLGVGLLVTVPVSMIAWVAVYRDLERQTKLPKLELMKVQGR